MSSVGEAVVEGGLAVTGFVVGSWFGAPGLGASLGYQIGDGLWNVTHGSSDGSSSAGLGPVNLTKSHRLPVPLVYGKHLVSGNVIYQDAYGDDSPKLDLQVAVSEGPIEAINSIKVNDNALDSSRYSTRLGNRSQSATSMNSGSNHPFTAYIAASLDAEEMELSGVPTITSIVKGRQIEVYDGSSWVTQYSNNPAYILLDFLTNDRYGLGIDDSQIDKDSFIAVANWCDETVNGDPRFTLNTVLDRQASSLDIIKKMLQTFQSYLIYSGGELRLKADTVEDSVAQTFDENNIVQGSFSYRQVAGDQVPNVINAEYMEPDEGWQMVKATYQNDTDIRERDKRIEENIQLTGVTNFDQAGRITRVFHNQLYYNQFMASWEAGIDSIQCEPGDVVELSHSLTGWSNKKFRIMQIKEKENEQMEIVGREYNEQVFTDEGVDYQPPEGPTLPNPAEPPPDVESLSATEVKHDAKDATKYSTAQLTWSRPTDYPFYQRCNIYMKLGSSSTWPDSPIAEIKGTEWETDQLETNTYNFKFVTVNRNGIEADFASAPTVSLTVEGKTTKPSDVTFASGRFQNTVFLNWTPISDEDLDRYEVRTDLDWGNTTDALVYRGKSDQIQIDEFPIGGETVGTRSYTFYIKARNNSGLWSENYDSITVSNSAPTAPTLTVAEFFESFQVELSSVSGANGYEIEVDDGSTVKSFDLSLGEVLNYSATVGKTYQVRARSYDVIGPGDWGAWYTGIQITDLDSIAQYASDLRPAIIKETTPPYSEDYPDGTWVVYIANPSDPETDWNITMYKKVAGSWNETEPTFDVDRAVFPRVIAGTIQAGAISTKELAADAVTVDEIVIDDFLALSDNGQIAGGAAGFESGTGFWLGDYGIIGDDWRFYIGDKANNNHYLSYENGTIEYTGKMLLPNVKVGEGVTDAGGTAHDGLIITTDALSDGAKYDMARIVQYDPGSAYEGQLIDLKSVQDDGAGTVTTDSVFWLYNDQQNNNTEFFVKSPNFISGSQGWKLFKDGSAEFQNITARGDIETNTLSATGVEVGADVFTTTITDGIKVTSSAKVEITDVDGSVVFSSGGVFQGARLIDHGTAGQNEFCEGTDCLTSKSEIVKSWSSVSVPSGKAWIVTVEPIPDGTNGRHDLAYHYDSADASEGGMTDVHGYEYSELGVFKDGSGNFIGALTSADNGKTIDLYIHYHFVIFALGSENNQWSSTNVYWQLIEIPESAVG